MVGHFVASSRYRFLLVLAFASTCLLGHSPPSVRTHGQACIHDVLAQHAQEARAAERVLLLPEGSLSAGPVLNITRRELGLLPAFASHQTEHHRRLQSNTASYLARPWGGLRIHVEYVDVDGPGRDPAMTQAKADFLKNQIIPNVTSKLRTLLQVRFDFSIL